MAKRNVLLLLLAALVAAVGVALIASPATVAAARALLDWEDDLRPKAGDHSSDDSDYKLIDINYPCEELAKWSVGEFNERRLGPRIAYDRLVDVRRRVWLFPLRYTYKSLIDVKPDGYAVPGQKAPKQVETLVVLPGFGGGSRRMEGGHVTEWGPAYGKK